MHLCMWGIRISIINSIPMIHSRLSVTVFAEQALTDIFTFEATARYRDSDVDYKQTWISFLGAGTPRTLPDGTAAGRSWYDAPAGSEQYAIDARIRAEFETGAVEHEILAGISHQDVKTNSAASYLYALPTTFNVFSPDYSGSEIPDAATFDAFRAPFTESATKSTGYYINDQVTVGNFVLNAGVRFDDLKTGTVGDTQDDSATSFSVGGLYKTNIGFNPYVSYA